MKFFNIFLIALLGSAIAGHAAGAACKIPKLECKGLDFYKSVVPARWTTLGDPKCSTALVLSAGWGPDSNSVTIEVTETLMMRIDGSLVRSYQNLRVDPDTHSLVFQAQPGVEYKIKSTHLNASCVAE